MEIVLNKRNVTLIVIALLLLTLIGFTFAYFVGGVGTPAITDTSITGEKESRLQFTPGTPISLVSSLDNFSEGAGSLTGETTSTATLTSSSTQEVVSDEYFVYYYISDNNYVYTQNSSTPELILEVFDNEGNEITSLEGLTYVTTTDALTGETINGFDVTTYTGLIPIKENMPISATHPDNTTHEWNIKLTFINLDSDQTLNEGKEFGGKLMLQGDKFVVADLTLGNLGYTSEEIVAIKNKSTPNFDQIATTNEGLFATPDDYGTSYYYRGAVDNNWVYFAGFYWRIVRINGDGSVRMIYSGIIQPTELEAVTTNSIDIAIGKSVYNPGSAHTYGGYMYDFADIHGFENDSSIKIVVDNWYNDNLIDYSSYISDAIYCNDRNIYLDTTGTVPFSGNGKAAIYFGAAVRHLGLNIPTLECSVNGDSFTVDDEENGNGALTYPVALITADEMVMAGNVDPLVNKNNYLAVSSMNYYTMSPSIRTYSYNNITKEEFYYMTMWSLNATTFGTLGINLEGYVRPVISLNSDLTITGSGTWDDPYAVL